MTYTDVSFDVPDSMTLTITERASARLAQIAAVESIDCASTFLRVAIVPGGCSGLTYDLGWDAVRSESDVTLKEGELTLVFDPRSARYLDGTVLDFSDGLEGRGFSFDNPQATRSCACGDSFGV